MLKMNVTLMQPQKSPSKTPENNEKQSVIPMLYLSQHQFYA